MGRGGVLVLFLVVLPGKVEGGIWFWLVRRGTAVGCWEVGSAGGVAPGRVLRG